MARTGLLIDLQTSRGFDMIRIGGELDLFTSPELQGMLASEPLVEPVLVLDLNDVTFLDSSGIATVVAAMRLAGGHGGELVLVANSSQILKLLRIAGLHRMLAVYPDLTSCLEDLGLDPR